MTDLRHWSEEDATDEERELLREHRAPIDASRRRKIVVGLGVGAAVTASTTAASAFGLATKIIGAVVIGGAVAAGGYYATRPAPVDPTPTAVVAPPPPTTVAAITAPPTPSAIETTSAASPPPPPPATVAVTPKKATPAPSSSSLTQEVMMLGRVRSALAANNPDEALRVLDQYHAQFPAGKMASEEPVLRVQALMAKGDRAQAKAVADAFVAQHPDSPFVSRVQQLVAK